MPSFVGFVMAVAGGVAIFEVFKYATGTGPQSHKSHPTLYEHNQRGRYGGQRNGQSVTASSA